MSKIRTCSFVALLLVAVTAVRAQEAADGAEEAGPLEQTVPVADEPAAAAEEPQRNYAPTSDDVLSEHARFLQLLEEQNFDEADISAKRVIEMTIRLYGPVSHETAKALNNLGYVQNQIGEYDAAIQNFTSAVEILETVEDRLNSSLVNPLRGLGAAQLGSGRPDLAARTYDRATHITHVNEGPHNIEQVEILEALAEANVRRGDLEAARDVLDRIHILNVRHFDDNLVGLLPSLMRRASWQHRAGYYNDERATYRSAIRIIEESGGKDDPHLVEPLVRLGQSYYYYEPLADNSGGGSSTYGVSESYFKRANKIAESSDDISWFDKATTKLALADYYLARESTARARRMYEEAWNELSIDEDRMQMRGELLQNLTPIWEEPLPPSTKGAAGAKDRQDGSIQTGTVEVQYVVDERGRPQIERISTEPVEFLDMARTVEREIKGRRFRPVIVDGAAIASQMQTFRHEYRYRKTELEDIRASNAERDEERGE